MRFNLGRRNRNGIKDKKIVGKDSYQDDPGSDFSKIIPSSIKSNPRFTF